MLVYSRDSSDPEKHAIASDIMRRLWQDRNGVISTQVCNEFYVTVTRKLDPGLTPEEAWDDLDALFAWNPIPVDAACSQVGCAQILSENLNSRQEYLGIRVIDPFEVATS